MRPDARDPIPGATRSLSACEVLPAVPPVVAVLPYDDGELGYEAALPSLLGVVGGSDAAASRAATLTQG